MRVIRAESAETRHPARASLSRTLPDLAEQAAKRVSWVALATIVVTAGMFLVEGWL